MVAVLLAAPLVTHVLLLGEKHLLPRMADLRGVFADGSVALCVVAAVGLLLWPQRWWSRLLAWLALAAFVVATFAIYEVVSAFDSLHAIRYAGYLADPVFLGGSARHATHPAILVGLLAVGGLGVARAAPPGALWWRGWGIALGICVFAHAVMPMSQLHDGWRQRHAVHALLSTIPSGAGRSSGTVGAEVRGVFLPDLEGEQWLGPLPDRPNVLLILMEAASGISLPSVAAEAGVTGTAPMPKLDERAKGHLLFSNVVAHQRQTNRGEYSILCGDYPKLLSDQSKMTEQVYGEARRCLPAVLRDHGYTTAYIQAAPLGFMLKDQFLPKAGFQELVGDPAFERSYARTDWGVDDKAFFEQAVDRVAALHEGDAPFFATMLTVGTHHPFTILPAEGLEGPNDRRARAFAWADDALSTFLDELDARGVLEDTVVIITSDESSGPVQSNIAMQRVLAQNWSFAVVMLPEPRAERVDELVGHVDLALSVIDLLGVEAEGAPFMGRSWFRTYERPRKLFAGNTYLHRVMMWQPKSTVVCDEELQDCKRHARVKDSPFRPKRKGQPAAPRERRLLAEVARLTRSGRPEMTAAGAMTLLTADEVRITAGEGKKLLTGGQYLRVPAGTVLDVAFDAEVEGEGAEVELHQDVFIDGRQRFERESVRVRAGERWELRYQIGVVKDSSQLVVQLYATAVSKQSATLRFREAALQMRRDAGVTRKVEITADQVR